MFETAKWWADGIKVLGGGNGAGLLAAGAALSTFRDHHAALWLVKAGGVVFLVGVIAFALALFQVYVAMHAQDEVAHSLRRKDVDAINANSALSARSMIYANNCAMASAIAFFLGCIIGIVAFLAI